MFNRGTPKPRRKPRRSCQASRRQVGRPGRSSTEQGILTIIGRESSRGWREPGGLQGLEAGPRSPRNSRHGIWPFGPASGAVNPLQAQSRQRLARDSREKPGNLGMGRFPAPGVACTRGDARCQGASKDRHLGRVSRRGPEEFIRSPTNPRFLHATRGPSGVPLDLAISLIPGRSSIFDLAATWNLSHSGRLCHPPVATTREQRRPRGSPAGAANDRKIPLPSLDPPVRIGPFRRGFAPSDARFADGPGRFRVARSVSSDGLCDL